MGGTGKSCLYMKEYNQDLNTELLFLGVYRIDSQNMQRLDMGLHETTNTKAKSITEELKATIRWHWPG